MLLSLIIIIIYLALGIAKILGAKSLYCENS